jgi:hypothetical protein
VDSEAVRQHQCPVKGCKAQFNNAYNRNQHLWKRHGQHLTSGQKKHLQFKINSRSTTDYWSKDWQQGLEIIIGPQNPPQSPTSDPEPEKSSDPAPVSATAQITTGTSNEQLRQITGLAPVKFVCEQHGNEYTSKSGYKKHMKRFHSKEASQPPTRVTTVTTNAAKETSLPPTNVATEATQPAAVVSTAATTSKRMVSEKRWMEAVKRASIAENRVEEAQKKIENIEAQYTSWTQHASKSEQLQSELNAERARSTLLSQQLEEATKELDKQSEALRQHASKEKQLQAMLNAEQVKVTQLTQLHESTTSELKRQAERWADQAATEQRLKKELADAQTKNAKLTENIMQAQGRRSRISKNEIKFFTSKTLTDVTIWTGMELRKRLRENTIPPATIRRPKKAANRRIQIDDNSGSDFEPESATPKKWKSIHFYAESERKVPSIDPRLEIIEVDDTQPFDPPPPVQDRLGNLDDYELHEEEGDTGSIHQWVTKRSKRENDEESESSSSSRSNSSSGTSSPNGNDNDDNEIESDDTADIIDLVKELVNTADAELAVKKKLAMAETEELPSLLEETTPPLEQPAMVGEDKATFRRELERMIHPDKVEKFQPTIQTREPEEQEQPEPP